MRFSALPAALFALIGALAGCQAVAGEPVAPESKAAAASAASEAPAVAEYTVKIVPGEAKAGQEAATVVEVTPAPGYKMNVEFPSRLKGLAGAGATFPKAELDPDAENTTPEKVLRFKVPFTAASAGKVELNGLADFSVCNERACKLIRDEKLAWAVEVK